jgi:hypothetical protein
MAVTHSRSWGEKSQVAAARKACGCRTVNAWRVRGCVCAAARAIFREGFPNRGGRHFNDLGTLNAIGVPHSEQMHLTERIRRPDLGHLEVEATVEDPKVLVKPWTLKRTANLAPREEIMEFICNENNRDPGHLAGK